MLTGDWRQRSANRPWVVATIVIATIASVFPGFLVVAMSVQVAAELDVNESAYGWAMGGFFASAALGSVGFGRLAQRIGPRRQIIGGLTVTLALELLVAFRQQGWVAIVLCISVCGATNAATQSAVNLALTRARLNRLGLALALKQSAMPASAMLGGLAVPALALTFGWRWGFGFAAALSLTGILAVIATIEPGKGVGGAPVDRAATPTSTRGDLWTAAAATGCLSFTASALNAWVVSSGVNAGLSEGVAGLMLSVGAGCGVALRVIVGTRLDHMRARPFLVAGLIVYCGVAGAALLSFGDARAHMAATVVAFAGGWVWPVFTNFGIVRANRAAAAAASGITQTGVYVGAFVAPLVTGWLIHRFGYPMMWTIVAGIMTLGATLAVLLRDRF